MSRSSAATSSRRPSLTSGCRMNDDMPDIVAATESVPRRHVSGADVVRILSSDRKSAAVFFTSGLARHKRSILLPISSQGFGRRDELLGESMIAVVEFNRWKAVQKAKLEGLSLRAISRELAISRLTVRKHTYAEMPTAEKLAGKERAKLVALHKSSTVTS